MNKRGLTPWTFLIILIVAVVGIFWAIGNFEVGGFTIGEPGAIEDVQLNCGDDIKGNINVKLEDDGASSETFIASSTIYLRDLDSGILINSSSSSSSAWTTFDDKQCGKQYELIAVAQAGAAGSARSGVFTLAGEDEYYTIHTNKVSKLSIKVNNIDTDSNSYSADASTIYHFADGVAEGTNSTGYVDMNTTNIYTSTAPGDIAVGSDGYLEATYVIKAATNLYRANDLGRFGSGDKGDATITRNIVCEDNAGTAITCRPLRNFICVNTGSDREWDDDTWTITFDGTTKTTDAKSLIDDDSSDYSVIADIERCALIGDVDSNPHNIYSYIAAKSGENPDSTNDDLQLYHLGEGLYASSDNGDLIKAGIYTDASTTAAVLYTIGTEDPIIEFQIS